MGTPAYMAPEQVRGAADLDARADVFALGCLLYRCLTGRSAFAAEDPVAVLTKIVLDEPRRPSELGVPIPVALELLLARMLDKDRGGRPADGAAVAAELRALVAADVPSVEITGGTIPPSTELPTG